uniref:Uncharacterized protein n=1 Tax=Lactuca sativa TaxID=4236 RepID=A0A9R1WDJ7_LACSA|nr:hypothetical protein LSAT_V11C100043780 [Lactuca sativa]
MNDEPIIDNEPIIDDEYDCEVGEYESEFHSLHDAKKHYLMRKPLIDDMEVNMINFCSVLDEDIDLGQPNQTNNTTEEHEDIEDGPPLEVLDNNVFESFASEQEPRKKLLKSILKPVRLTQKLLRLVRLSRKRKKIREIIANYYVKERRDLHYIKNDKTSVRVKCRGFVPKLTSGSNKGKGNLVHSKKTTCPRVLFISRVDEKQVWTVKTYEDCHSCLQTRTVRACSSKFLANNILHQVESNPKIPTHALQEDLVQRYSLLISNMEVFWEKAMAKQFVYGDYEKQYGILREYVMEL